MNSETQRAELHKTIWFSEISDWKVMAGRGGPVVLNTSRQ